MKDNEKLAEYLETDNVKLCEDLILIKTALAAKGVALKKTDKLTRKRVYSMIDNAKKQKDVAK
ncbi:hypothetical protein [Apilactobacillus nanyangensis]|uniref:hypothetical protein n=1 Tax=Apilactobacillus nanyangensis TaxID=2799579 RepID=UPI001945978A|nr:hypothetical protein [Apilactobacillus nanyangensis]